MCPYIIIHILDDKSHFTASYVYRIIGNGEKLSVLDSNLHSKHNDVYIVS